MSGISIEEEIQHADIAVDAKDQAAYELARMRHSTAHLMAEAIQELYPDVKFAIGPAIENGFYYDIDLPQSLTPDDLAEIEKLMAGSSGGVGAVRHEESSRDEALAIFGDNPYKVELIEGFPEGEAITTYQRGSFWIFAADRTFRIPARSVRSTASPSRALTGAVMNIVRCSSASTERPGQSRKNSTISSTGWKRRSAGITCCRA
ncbi:MAG: hypothetical protein R2845_07875 [Thermomicrobiales bacterium]